MPSGFSLSTALSPSTQNSPGKYLCEPELVARAELGEAHQKGKSHRSDTELAGKGPNLSLPLQPPQAIPIASSLTGGSVYHSSWDRGWGEQEESSESVIESRGWELGSLGLSLCQLWGCGRHYQHQVQALCTSRYTKDYMSPLFRD